MNLARRSLHSCTHWSFSNQSISPPAHLVSRGAHIHRWPSGSLIAPKNTKCKVAPKSNRERSSLLWSASREQLLRARNGRGLLKWGRSSSIPFNEFPLEAIRGSQSITALACVCVTKRYYSALLCSLRYEAMYAVSAVGIVSGGMGGDVVQHMGTY